MTIHNEDYFVNGLRLPADLYHMIYNQCKRQEALTGFWPGVYPVIVDALYAHFRSVESSFDKEN